MYGRFRLTEDEVETIKAELKDKPSVERVYSVELADAGGQVHAIVDKTVHIRCKAAEPKA